ncbi:MAG: hypothetical protein AABY22_23975 [Nanoarchaeota archaeon]
MNFVPFTGKTFKPDPKPEKKEKSKPKRIAPRSAKRIEDNKEYLVKKDLFLETHKICEAGKEECAKHAVEVHHTYSGKDRDKYFLDESTWLAVCRHCHDWIHINSKEARKLGLLK